MNDFVLKQMSFKKVQLCCIKLFGKIDFTLELVPDFQFKFQSVD